MISLQTINLKYTYPPGIQALDDVNFTAGAGEFVMLLGPNGSGKTTLLKHFVGLLKPSSGSILLDHQDISTLSLTEVRTAVGFVFQDPNDQLFSPTVAEDVAYGPRNLGLDHMEAASRAEAALERVGMRGLEGRPIHALSFGQKRRVALAGVLAMSPKSIILDEPTSGLDPLGTSQLMALLRRLVEEQGVTVIVATQDIDLVPHSAERVYLMKAGKVVAAGRPPDIFSEPDLIYECGLRMPRAAHTLSLLGAELCHPMVDLPLSLEERADSHRNFNPGSAEAGGLQYNPHRRGFTTGIAAAAAAKAAAELLLRGRKRDEIELRSSLGEITRIPIASAVLDIADRTALATVVKVGTSADDVTDGAQICAAVAVSDLPGVRIDGSDGVGRVTRNGHPLNIGEAAINPVPRQMIADAVMAMLPAGTGLNVVISVPNGEELAKRTNNAQMGIIGGISILGTGLGGHGAPLLQREFGDLERAQPATADNKAVVLVGHGSRAAGANEAIYETAEHIKRNAGLRVVEVGFMQLCSPSIEQSVARCVEQGATRIVVVPYFLHLGVHMQKDLPEIVDSLKPGFPEAELILGRHLAFHPKLAEIVVERINEIG